MKRVAYIFLISAMLSHALMSAVAGSLNPGDWSPLELHALASAPLPGLLDP